MYAPGVRRARARPGLVGRTGGAASRRCRATSALRWRPGGQTGPTTRPRRCVHLRRHHHAPRPDPDVRAHAGGAPARLGPAHEPGAHSAVGLLRVRRTLAPRPAPVAQRPRAGAPIPARGAPNVSGRTARAKHPRDREHRTHPCNPRHLQCRTPAAGQELTDRQASILPGHRGSKRAWPTPPPGHARSSELVCGTSCHRRCCALLLYSRLRLSIYSSDLGGAKGTRTPGLLHAISRQHVHPCLSPQVTVPERTSGSASVRGGCCTFLLYPFALASSQPTYA
jgi:hypothetical protein